MEPEHAATQLLKAALDDSRVSRSEFAAGVGVSEEHLTAVLDGEATAGAAALDHWATVLGRWDAKVSTDE